MIRLIIDITDPAKEKEVAEVLGKMSGVKVTRAKALPKQTSAGTVKRALSPKEKRFVAELRQAIKEVRDHDAGRITLPLARDLLDEL